jgi:hypothetical protein
VQENTVDRDQGGITVQLADDVLPPDFFEEGLGHSCGFSSGPDASG